MSNSSNSDSGNHTSDMSMSIEEHDDTSQSESIDSHGFDDHLDVLEQALNFVDGLRADGSPSAAQDEDQTDFADVAWDDTDEANKVSDETKLLFVAAKRGDAAAIAKFIDRHGADVSARNAHGATALSYAAIHGHAEAVKALLDRGADVSSTSVLGASPLSLAAARGHQGVVSLLIPKMMAEKSDRHLLHRAFCEAASNGHEAVVERFIAASETPDALVVECEADTPLHRAAKRGHVGIVKMLIAHGADVERIGRTGETPLQLAAEHNQLECVKDLLNHGALVNRKAEVISDKDDTQYAAVHGGTALTRAAYRGHADVVDHLLLQGADPTAVDDDGDTPLIAAVAEKHPLKEANALSRIMHALLGAGCDVNQKGHQNNSAVLVAASSGLGTIVQELIEKFGACVDISNDEGDTLLISAIEHCAPEVVRAILDKGADINRANKQQDTPLQKAVEINAPSIVGWLLDAGAQVDARNHQDDTALIMACQLEADSNATAIVRQLVDAGANANAENKNGENPLRSAIFNNAAEIMCLLLRAGAEVEWTSDDGVAVFDCINSKCPNEAVEVLTRRLDEVTPTDLESMLERALTYDLPKIVPALVERGRNVLDSNGNTLLMLAVESNNVVTVKHLLDCGFEYAVRNKAGVSAMQLATRLGHFGCFLALNGVGAELTGSMNEKLMLAALQQRWGEVESLMRAQNAAADANQAESGRLLSSEGDASAKRRYSDVAGSLENVSANKRARLSVDSVGTHSVFAGEMSPHAVIKADVAPLTPISEVQGGAVTPQQPLTTNPDAAISSLSWLADLCEMDASELLAPSRSVAHRILLLVRKQLSFAERLEMFRARMEDLVMEEDSVDGSIDSLDEVLHVHVSRGSVLYDAYKSLRRVSSAQIRLPLSVSFEGEDGQDDGGLSREFFNELAGELTKAGLALLREVPEGSGAFQPNPDAHVQEDVADVPSLFQFIGRMVGKAIAAFHVFNIKFTHSFLKQMLQGKLTIEDLESVDPAYYKGLIHARGQNVEDSGLQDETFTTEENFFGDNRVIELKPGGANIPVTNANKEEYITLLARHRMTTSIKPYIEAFCTGLWEVVPADMLQAFSPTELGEVISGFPEIDINDMQEHVKYEGFDAKSQIIRWFWQILREMPHEETASLLQFITGSPKVPARGFEALDPPITIKRGSANRLPSAHTCINQLVLSEYKSRQALASHLKEIIGHATGFGFA